MEPAGLNWADLNTLMQRGAREEPIMTSVLLLGFALAMLIKTNQCEGVAVVTGIAFFLAILELLPH